MEQQAATLRHLRRAAEYDQTMTDSNQGLHAFLRGIADRAMREKTITPEQLKEAGVSTAEEEELYKLGMTTPPLSLATFKTMSANHFVLMNENDVTGIGAAINSMTMFLIRERIVHYEDLAEPRAGTKWKDFSPVQQAVSRLMGQERNRYLCNCRGVSIKQVPPDQRPYSGSKTVEWRMDLYSSEKPVARADQSKAAGRGEQDVAKAGSPVPPYEFVDEVKPPTPIRSRVSAIAYEPAGRGYKIISSSDIPRVICNVQYVKMASAEVRDLPCE